MRKPLLFALALVLAPSLARAASPYRVTELFPVEPGINAERGFAVAVDGDWMAMGAPRDDDREKDSGAVYLFEWSGTTWDQRAKLFADRPQPGAQLGFALAMRNGVLAAGAPGEGAVYVFRRGDVAWSQERRLTKAKHGAGTFGRSIALDDDRLAVGAVDVHGARDGAVYLYKVDSWLLEQPPVRPQPRQKGERFGTAVSLAGSVLVVGAPGEDSGTVYVFQKGPARWKEQAKLLPADGGAGGQYGFAVATDGTQIFAGAPTADPAGDNSGAVYRFVQSAGVWIGQKLPNISGAGAQLGSSLALSSDLLVAGAPAPPPGTGPGTVHVFRRSSDAWEESLVPGNAEIRDLTGFATAVDGERVVVGGVLGDQGGGAAGAAWSFHCPGGDACVEEAEAVARNPRSGPRFGASVALTADALAVGEPEEGSVSVYRPAGGGWRQEAWLISPYAEDGFGSSVALAGSALTGSLLAAGAPQPRSSLVSGSPDDDFPDGSVDLFIRHDSSWVFEGTLAPPPTDQAFNTPAAFGASVAIADGVVAVGAPGRGAVYLFEKGAQGWIGIDVLTVPAEGFGFAVSLRGRVLAIGAPGASGGRGAAYVSVRRDEGWTTPQLVLGRAGDQTDPSRSKAVVTDLPELGSAVSVGEGFLAIGAPGFHGDLGAVYLLTGSDTSWGQPVQLSALAPRRFGSSVALYEDRLVVGGPGREGAEDPNDLDRAAVFERRAGSWEVVADLDALQPPQGDKFGAAVALSGSFCVVTSPGPARGDRVTVFELPPEEGENP